MRRVSLARRWRPSWFISFQFAVCNIVCLWAGYKTKIQSGNRWYGEDNQANESWHSQNDASVKLESDTININIPCNVSSFDLWNGISCTNITMFLSLSTFWNFYLASNMEVMMGLTRQGGFPLVDVRGQANLLSFPTTPPHPGPLFSFLFVFLFSSVGAIPISTSTLNLHWVAATTMQWTCFIWSYWR